MIIDPGGASGLKLQPMQELKLNKSSAELYVGQILKTAVIKTLGEDQVLIHINGQNINAKTAHHFSPGQLLNVKVMAAGEDIVLQVIPDNVNANKTLQNAWLQALPKQMPANQLLALLNQLSLGNQLPMQLQQQIRALLANLTPLAQLPEQIHQAVLNSGLFWEAALSLWRKEQGSGAIQSDFKALLLKVFASLSPKASQIQAAGFIQEGNTPPPLPDSIPEPLAAVNLPNLSGLSSDTLQALLHQMIDQALARLTALQVSHLKQDPSQGYQLMLDLPINTPQGPTVIPLKIKQYSARPLESAHWTLTAAVNLPQLGSLQVHLSLARQELDLRLNAQLPGTQALLEDKGSEVKGLFRTIGLKLRHYQVKLGLDENPPASNQNHLLDIKV